MHGYLLGFGGKPVKLQRGQRITIGRGAKNTHPIKDALLSRKHAVIEVSEEGVTTVQDLGSTNSTWLNERRVEADFVAPLCSGDVIRLGCHLLTYLSFSKGDGARTTQKEGKGDEEPQGTDPDSFKPEKPQQDSSAAVVREDADWKGELATAMAPAEGNLAFGNLSLLGEIADTSLPELLVVLHHAQETGELAVERGDDECEIAFEEGRIVFAQLRDASGITAIESVARWNGGFYNFQREEKVERVANVSMPTTELVFHCCEWVEGDGI